MEEILATSDLQLFLNINSILKLNMLQRRLVKNSRSALHAICTIYKYKIMQCLTHYLSLKVAFKLHTIKKLVLHVCLNHRYATYCNSYYMHMWKCYKRFQKAIKKETTNSLHSIGSSYSTMWKWNLFLKRSENERQSTVRTFQRNLTVCTPRFTEVVHPDQIMDARFSKSILSKHW
jgi:hypothetical protein